MVVNLNKNHVFMVRAFKLQFLFYLFKLQEQEITRIGIVAGIFNILPNIPFSYMKSH